MQLYALVQRTNPREFARLKAVANFEHCQRYVVPIALILVLWRWYLLACGILLVKLCSLLIVGLISQMETASVHVSWRGLSDHVSYPDRLFPSVYFRPHDIYQIAPFFLSCHQTFLILPGQLIYTPWGYHHITR